ncbi:TPA: hypothetical protein ACH3X3_011132 [Trebouxia sp. C0006]
MNAAFGGSEAARQPFRPIWPADRPTDGDPALAAALNNAHAAISQDLLPPAPALAYGHASDPPYSACSSPDSMTVEPIVRTSSTSSTAAKGAAEEVRHK